MTAAGKDGVLYIVSNGFLRYTRRITDKRKLAMKLEIKKIGNSTGIIMPKELLQDFDLSQGDWVYVSRQQDGKMVLAKREETFERGMEIARKAMKRYENALRELAK
jgi:putative addiction module antidote